MSRADLRRRKRLLGRRDAAHGASSPRLAYLTCRTNDFAWLYQRCAKAVGVCSPAYFAHLACTRAKAHLAAARATDDDSMTIVRCRRVADRTDAADH